MLRQMWAGAVLLAVAAGGRAADQGAAVEIDGMKSPAPAGWKKGNPASQMQYAVFSLPKADGDKEDTTLTIYFFGQGGGGGVPANIKRWQGMFKPPAAENSKTESIKVGAVPVTTLDISGTFLFKARPMDATAVEKPDYRMVGVVFESKNGPYFMRFVGPAKSVEKNKKDFDEWLKNFK